MMSKIDKDSIMRELVMYNPAYFVAGSMRGTLLLLPIIFWATALGDEYYYSQLINEEFETQRG